MITGFATASHNRPTAQIQHIFGAKHVRFYAANAGISRSARSRPKHAALSTFARRNTAFCAAGALWRLRLHAFNTGACKARPPKNADGHGNCAVWIFVALRGAVANSLLLPRVLPDIFSA